MKTSFLLSVCCFLPIGLVSGADDKTQVWTDPEMAQAKSADFGIQGEYFKEDAPVAAQIIAKGEGVFEAWILEGGLPGQGWEKGKERKRLVGKLDEGIVTFPTTDGVSALLDQGSLTIQRGEIDAIKLPRVVRQSPTLEAEAPEGATVLFDGTNVDQWINGKMKDGLLLATGTTSKVGFKDYKLHLEFRTPFKPKARGQGRGNSGVYFGGRWETQVLDSFGLEGKMNECGGIYSIAAPSTNACFPPLTWQTYDVDFTAAKFDDEGKRTAWPRMTVRLNGILIHDDQVLAKSHTTAAPLSKPLTGEPLPVFLQDHGNPVVFRNIWVLPKKKNPAEPKPAGVGEEN